MTPAAGFNWMRVSWGGPDERVAETCSYCDAQLEDEEVPLIIWNANGWCARFCHHCQRTWWGMRP